MHACAPQRVLWEQDLFKDALLHAAFDVPPSLSRHARNNADPPPEGFASDPNATARRWQTESVKLAGRGLPAQTLQWLPLLATHTGRALTTRDIAIGADRASLAWRESAVGLPLWIFSPWNVPPHGSACAGQWAVRPSPVMIGHLVGCTSKHLIMRQLGWWRYEVSAADAFAAAHPLLPPTTPRSRRGSATSVSPPADLATLMPSTRPWRAFPADTRVMVLRRHALRMSVPTDVYAVWDAIRRFAMLALALGRRAVVPLIPCALQPCAPRVPDPLRPLLYTVTLGDAAACAEPGNATVEDVALGSTTERDLTPRAVDSPLGWQPTPDPSEWWWDARRVSKVRHGCCQPIPSFGACIDAAGARRPLGTEPLLSTADLGRLLAEMRHASSGAARNAAPSDAAPPPASISTVQLSGAWSDDSLDELRSHARARVLVLDAGGQGGARLPSVEWLIAHGGAAADAEEAIGAHASRCFIGLGRAQIVTKK